MMNLSAFLHQAPDTWRLELCPKPIKHIYFRVFAAEQVIRVSMPVQTQTATLQQAFNSRATWILKQIEKAQARKQISGPFSERIISGQGSFKPESFQQEDIYHLRGKPHHLILAAKTGAARVFTNTDRQIILQAGPRAGMAAKEKAMATFLRNTLMADIQALSRIWEPRIGVRAKEYRIRKMKTRWGSCNIKAKRIWINQALIHLDPQFLSYVLVHELIHLIERRHNKRFYNFMARYIPDWKNLKDRLRHVAL